MFVVLLTYKKPLAEVEQHLQAHRQFLDESYRKGYFLASGPRVPREGGVILVRSMERQALEAHLLNDPFYSQQIADYTLIEFEAVKYADCLAAVV